MDKLETNNTSRPVILVVDDEEVIRSLLQTLFEKDGRFDVDTACDGEEALVCIENREYSLVITDLQMPNMNGLELLKRLKATHPHLPVIVFTGYGDVQDAIGALRLGAVNFLRKPFEFKEILPSVEKAVEVAARTERRKIVYRYLDTLQMSLTIPPRLDQTDSVIQHLVDPLVPLEIIPEAEIKNIFLALDEIIINAIAYGSLQIDSSVRDLPDGFAVFEKLVHERESQEQYAARNVIIRALYTPEKVVYHIQDPGLGFDHRNLPDPTNPANLLREHGRGLLLVRCFVDEVVFNDAGNQVTLVKNREI